MGKARFELSTLGLVAKGRLGMDNNTLVHKAPMIRCGQPRSLAFTTKYSSVQDRPRPEGMKRCIEVFCFLGIAIIT